MKGEYEMAEKNMFDLSGRVALVTGGGYGIGRSICEAMAEFGADVAIADINEELAKETSGLLTKFGHRTLAIRADVSDSRAIDHMVNETVTKLGSIDILFNNAGFILGKFRIHETSDEVWDKTMAVNLKGVFLCTRAALPVMMKQKKGSIINTASIGGILPGDPELKSAIYNVAKAGVICFTRQAAAEYGRDGIRINAIAPGIIEGTNFATVRRKNLSPEEAAKLREKRAERIPLGRPGRPDDLKGIAVYLASDASSYATGQVFVVDAGIF